MKVSEIYREKQNKDCPSKKGLSFEIFPPKKDSELKNIDETLSVLCELEPDYISVTFGAGGSANCNRDHFCPISADRASNDRHL